jgi:hypothetical protein
LFFSSKAPFPSTFIENKPNKVVGIIYEGQQAEWIATQPTTWFGFDDAGLTGDIKADFENLKSLVHME